MLLAARRLTDDPRASFGAIAGVIMAVFVASAFFSFVAYADDQQFDRAGVIAADQVYVEMPYNEGPAFAEVPARIAAVPGSVPCCPSRPPSSWRPALRPSGWRAAPMWRGSSS